MFVLGTIAERKKLPDSEIAKYKDTYGSLMPFVFDVDFYLRTNPDVKTAAIDPFVHFCNNGFFEGRNPSAIVILSYCKWLGRLHNLAIDTPLHLFDFLRRILSHYWFGPHPCISPRWIYAQIMAPSSSVMSLVDLFTQSVPTPTITWHPALTPIRSDNHTSTLYELFANTDSRTLYAHSLVDLTQYVDSHNDLKSQFPAVGISSHAEVFQHAFSRGLLENRLKYIGTTAPKWATPDEIFVSCVATILLNTTTPYLHSSDSSIRTLPVANTQLIDISTNEHERLVNCSTTPGTVPPDIDTLLALNSIASKRSSALIRLISHPVLPPTYSHDIDLRAPSVLRRAELLDRDIIARNDNSPLAGKRVVFSTLLNGYDEMPVPPVLSHCQYYLVTDSPIDLISEPWIAVRPTIRERDTKRTCLWYKTHPHYLFPHAQLCLWLDANIVCNQGSETVLLAHEALSEVATFYHPDRQCVYEEAAMVKTLKLDGADVVDSVVDRMERAGMPRHFGLYETNVLSLRTSDFGVREFLDHWWSLISGGSRRDQLSFTVSAWSNRIDVSTLDGRRSARDSKYFRKRPHRSQFGRFV